MRDLQRNTLQGCRNPQESKFCHVANDVSYQYLIVAMFLLLHINSVNWMGGVILVVTVLASGSGICELLRSFMPMTLILVYLIK